MYSIELQKKIQLLESESKMIRKNLEILQEECLKKNDINSVRYIMSFIRSNL